MNEDIPERDLGGGRGRFHFRGNGRDQNGQYRSGFASIRDERRRDIRLEMPPEPEPSRFFDWSNLGSPPTRTSPISAPDVQTEQLGNAQNQLNMTTTGATRPERVEVGNSEGVTIASQTEPWRENQDTNARPASLSIETRTQRDDMESSEENVHIILPVQMRSARSSSIQMM